MRRLTIFAVCFLALTATAHADPNDPIPYAWSEPLKPGKAERLAEAYLTEAKKNPTDLKLREKAAVLLLAAWKLEGKDLKKRHRLSKAIIATGKEMIKIAPEKPHGYHWYGVGIEAWGLSRGILNSLQLVPEGKKALERSIALDPTYLFGSAQLQLGRALLLLPGFPLSIGNRDEALRLTLEGVKQNPNFTMGVLYLADLYWMIGRNEDALREAQKVATLKPNNEYEYITYEVAVDKARFIIDQIKAGATREPYVDWIWMELQPGLID